MAEPETTGCKPALCQDNLLCDLCRKVVDAVAANLQRNGIVQSPRKGGTDLFNEWWHDVAELKTCAGIGCNLCAFALASKWKNPLEQMAEWPFNTFMIHAAIFAESELRHGAIYIVPPAEGKRKEDFAASKRSPLPFAVWFSLADIEDAKMLQFIPTEVDHGMPSFDVGSSTASDETFNKISRWLNMCKTHKHCKEWHSVGGVESAVSPTRLLRIDGPSTCPVVKLVQGADIPLRPIYATLSHCWGGAPIGKLLKSNVSKYCDSVPWESLSRTFREVVSAALRLDMQYLWIDALCILQDDIDDWTREAQRMAVVYANSALNISADASSNGDEGLFRDRIPDEAGYFKVPSRRKTCLPDLWFYQDTFIPDVEWSPLAGRAWVIQERFLAPRVLHFCEHRVAWECIQMSRLDSLPLDLPYTPVGGSVLQRSRIRERARSFSSSQLFDIWATLLWSYSRSQLTIGSDRPVAMLGFAKAYMNLCGWQESDYLCGLWRPQLVHLLPWRRHGNTKIASSREEFPSWSWLSISKGVVIDGGPKGETWEETASIVKVSLPSITIRGPLCRAVARSTDRPFLPDRTVVNDEVEWLLEVGDVQLRETEHFNKTMDCVTELELAGSSAMEVFLLLLRAKSMSGDESTPGNGNTSDGESTSETCDSPAAIDTRKPDFHGGRYECLVLQPAEIPGYFRRIGQLQVRGIEFVEEEQRWKDSMTTMHFVCCTLDEQSKSPDLPPHLYHERDKDFMYTITLV